MLLAKSTTALLYMPNISTAILRLLIGKQILTLLEHCVTAPLYSRHQWQCQSLRLLIDKGAHINAPGITAPRYMELPSRIREQMLTYIVELLAPRYKQQYHSIGKKWF
jgi:hypothetical protein